MDNLCHALAGAALGEAGLKRRSALGMATLIVASNLPDIDVAVFATDALPQAVRRGWTHGVLAMALLPPAFAAVMFAIGRLRTRARPGAVPLSFGGLVLLAYLGTWGHVFMDFLNSYGVRLLMPFSERWFYGDALYIVDPILYALFGGSIIVSRIRARRGDPAPWRFARAGVIAAGVYMALTLISNVWARAHVREGLQRAGRPADTKFMVTPVIFNPVRREVLIDVGDRYEKGFLWFDPLPHFRPAGYGVDKNFGDPAAVQAAQTPLARAYLQWSRFPFFAVERVAGRTRVFLADYRYTGPSGRESWLGVEIPIE